MGHSHECLLLFCRQASKLNTLLLTLVTFTFTFCAFNRRFYAKRYSHKLYIHDFTNLQAPWAPTGRSRTPLVELVGEDEALGVHQRAVLSLVLQEVPQVHSGQDAAVGRVAREHGVEVGPPQQLPAELLDLPVVQPAVGRAVALLLGKGGVRSAQIQR